MSFVDRISQLSTASMQNLVAIVLVIILKNTRQFSLFGISL